MAEERRVTFRMMFEIAVTLIGALAMLLWLSASDRIGKAEAKIDRIQDQKADKEMVLRMYDDVKDIREMMTSHIIETGSGKVKKKRSSE